LSQATDNFIVSIIRPATVCGYSPRLRLDLTVNILTNHALNQGVIQVFGGDQLRPNIHIEDMTDLYCLFLEYESSQVHKKIFNAGYQNYKVRDIALMVKSVIGSSVSIKTVPTDDHRSYRISSHKLREELGYEPSHTIEMAIKDLKGAFEEGKIVNPMNNPVYYNIKTMRKLHEKS